MPGPVTTGDLEHRRGVWFAYVHRDRNHCDASCVAVAAEAEGATDPWRWPAWGHPHSGRRPAHGVGPAASPGWRRRHRTVGDRWRPRPRTTLTRPAVAGVVDWWCESEESWPSGGSWEVQAQASSAGNST